MAASIPTRQVAQPGEVGRALGACLDFLRRRMDGSGLWSDFRTGPGASDEWVTAFVSAQLRGVAGAAPLRAAAADALLRRQRPDGGWGYNRKVASDADSTAWAVLALRDGAPAEALVEAGRFLLTHQGPDGGFFTYHPRHRPASGLRREWFERQPCVTAAVVQALVLLPGNDAVEAAARGQRSLRCLEPGSLASCWWSVPEYVRLQVALALHSVGRTPAAAPSPGAFAAALRVLFASELSGGTDTAETKDDLHYLVSTQRADGSWPTRPILRVPDATPGVTAHVADHVGVFTAATAARALSLGGQTSR